MASVRLGTYIGTGVVEGATVTYQLHFPKPKFGWLDYKMRPPIASAPEESWHAEGAYTIADGILNFEVGGLPGQGRAGQVYAFKINEGQMGAVVLEKDGIKCQPQADTIASEGGEAAKCAKCGNMLHGQVIQAEGAKFCVSCFVCDACGKALTGAFKKMPDGKRLCNDCTPKTPKKYCEACKQPITGKSVIFNDLEYHPECFCCHNCQKPLSGGVLKKKENLYCCKECATGKVPAVPKAAPPGGPADEEVQASAPAPAPKAAAAAPKAAPKAQPISALGSYRGKQQQGGDEVTYTVILNDDFLCWLDCAKSSKISSSSWHSEGEYEESEGGKKIKFTVSAKPFGGGPATGQVFNFDANSAAKTITVEGVQCSMQDGVVAPEFQEAGEAKVDQAAAKAPAAAEAKAKAAAPAPKAAPAPVAAPAAAPAAAQAAAPAAAPAAGSLTLVELKDPEVCKAKDVDPSKKEEYLADAEFQSLFGASKAEFAAKPKWKRDKEKKDKGLF